MVGSPASPGDPNHSWELGLEIGRCCQSWGCWVQAEPGAGSCSAHLLLVVSGNSAPYFNMTLVYVPEDLELGEWGSFWEALGCRRSSWGEGWPGQGLRLPVSPGEEAFQLTAIDVDGDPLTYSISGSDAYYFSVDGKTGKVTLKNSLDREVRAETRADVPAQAGGIWGDGDGGQSRESCGRAADAVRWGRSLALKPGSVWELSGQEHPARGWRVGGRWCSAIQGSSSTWP